MTAMNPKRVAAFMGGASLAALASACSPVPQGPSMPVRYDLAPSYYRYAAQRPYRPPQTYAADNPMPVPPPAAALFA